MLDQYTICLVIPAYNEEVGLTHFLKTLSDQMEKTGLSYVISVTDDGSKDNTWEEIKTLKGKMPIIASQFSKNFGKDAAVFASIEAVDAEAYIIMDADGQHPIELIPTYIELWQKEGYDVINGIKDFGDNESHFRITFSRAFNYLFEKLSGLNLMNSTDYKLISRRVAKQLLNCGDYYIFFRALSKWIGFKQTNIHFQIKKRELGIGKWPTSKLFIYSLNAILLYSYVPLYLLLAIGIGVLTLSILLFIKLIIFYFLGELPTGYSTLLTIMLLTMSINVISISIIGLYLQKVLDQVKYRPRYIVMEKIQ